jgi:hypothetical protein
MALPPLSRAVATSLEWVAGEHRCTVAIIFIIFIIIIIICMYHHQHHLYTSSSGRPVGCMSILLKQHLNKHKQQLRALGLQIIIHRLTVTTTHQGTDVRERQGWQTRIHTKRDRLQDDVSDTSGRFACCTRIANLL